MRAQHIENVALLISEICDHYKIKSDKYRIAAEYHDICRTWENKKLISFCKNIDNIPAFYRNNPALLHAPAAAHIAENDGINDADILHAIAFHPTGSKNMSDILKFLMLADFSEPARTFKQAHIVRKKIFEDIDEAFKLCILYKIQFCLVNEQEIFPESIMLYNTYLQLLSK